MELHTPSIDQAFGLAQAAAVKHQLGQPMEPLIEEYIAALKPIVGLQGVNPSEYLKSIEAKVKFHLHGLREHSIAPADDPNQMRAVAFFESLQMRLLSEHAALKLDR